MSLNIDTSFETKMTKEFRIESILKKHGELEYLNTDKLINRICEILEHMFPTNKEIINKHSNMTLEQLEELTFEYENELAYILKKCGINYPDDIFEELYKL